MSTSKKWIYLMLMTIVLIVLALVAFPGWLKHDEWKGTIVGQSSSRTNAAVVNRTVVKERVLMSPPAVNPTTSYMATLEELTDKAKHGDREAASLMAEYSNHCSALKNFADISDMYLGRNTDGMSRQDLEAYESGLDAMQKMLQKYQGFCRSYGDYLINSQLDNLLTAGELGDVNARHCLIAHVTDLSNAKISSDDLDKYRNAALSFADDGLMQGDWNVVKLIKDAYTPTSYFRKNNAALLVQSSAMMAYRYAKLLQLGSTSLGTDAPVTNTDVAFFVSNLQPGDIKVADAWADNAYKQYFLGNPTYKGDVDCR